MSNGSQDCVNVPGSEPQPCVGVSTLGPAGPAVDGNANITWREFGTRTGQIT